MSAGMSKGALRRWVKIALAAAMLCALVAAFCGAREFAAAAKVQAVPAFLAGNLAAIACLAALAAVFGRLYCEIACPLGIVQDLVRWIARKRVRRVCSRLPESRRQIAVKWAIFALFLGVGLAGLSFMWLDPYAIFGRGISLSGGLFFIVIALALSGRGRFWCNWVCPVGTVLQAVSRHAIFKDKVDVCDHCKECRKCMVK